MKDNLINQKKAFPIIKVCTTTNSIRGHLVLYERNIIKVSQFINRVLFILIHEIRRQLQGFFMNHNKKHTVYKLRHL